MALLRLAEWILLSKLSQGCSPCNDNGRTPPALTEPFPTPVQLQNLWEHLPQQTHQAVFNVLTKMLDQALPATNREQSDE